MKPDLLWILAMVAVAASQTACTRSGPPAQAASGGTESSSTVVPVSRVTRANIASRTVLTAEFQPFQEVDVMAKVAVWRDRYAGRNRA